MILRAVVQVLRPKSGIPQPPHSGQGGNPRLGENSKFWGAVQWGQLSSIVHPRKCPRGGTCGTIEGGHMQFHFHRMAVIALAFCATPAFSPGVHADPLLTTGIGLSTCEKLARDLKPGAGFD